MQIFVGKRLNISQKLHGGARKDIEVCKKKANTSNRQMIYSSPLYELQMSISQNRPIRLVLCFVGAHHICVPGREISILKGTHFQGHFKRAA